MSTSFHNRRASRSVAWLAALAMLWQTVPAPAGLSPGPDVRGHVDVCSSAAPAGSPQRGPVPDEHDPKPHDCVHCASAMAQIAATPRAACRPPSPAPAVAGMSGEAAPRPLATALPPPACGPPVSSS